MLINSIKTQITDWSLYRNQKLQDKMPGLTVAFDAEQMIEPLQAALLAAPKTAARIVSCKLEKPAYFPQEDLCTLLYELQIQPETGGELEKHWVNGWLFPRRAACETFCERLLRPIVERGNGRYPSSPFTQAIACLPHLNLVVASFPVDDILTMLPDVIDRQQMQVVLQRFLPTLRPDGFKSEVVHYKPRHSCVIQYQVTFENGDEPPISLYGKASHHRGGAERIAVLKQLHNMQQNGAASFRFNLPQPLGHIPDLRLTLLGAVPGKPRRIFRLLRKRLGDKAALKPEALTLEEAIGDCARIAATLHTSGIEGGNGRFLTHDLINIHAILPAIGSHSPQFSAQLQHKLGQLESMAAATEPLQHCFSHGDFTYSQLLFNGHQPGLIDFDNICQAEPAFDLGRFLAYLRVAILRIQGDISPATMNLTYQLRAHFLTTYANEIGATALDEDRLQPRVLLYEFANLLLIATRNWQKFKPYRLAYVMSALDEIEAEGSEMHSFDNLLQGAFL